MSRNDGKPKSVVSVGVDPIPWVNKNSKLRHKEDPDCWVYCDFLPRPGFEQDKDKYPDNL